MYKYCIMVYTERRHTMSTLLKELTQFLARQPSALEAFMQSKQPKTHAEAEYWQKYFEYRGL
jgi:hypothetical protein